VNSTIMAFETRRADSGPDCPQLSKGHDVLVPPSLHAEACLKDAWLKKMDRLHQLAFKVIQLGTGEAQRWRVPKLMTDWHASGKSLRRIFPALLVEVGAGVEQPLEVAKDAPAVALHGNDALVAAFLRDLRSSSFRRSSRQG